MPRITAEREAATRQSILRAARDVFVAKGFHGATTHDVARAAGLSVGSIYTYFASKDELIRECVLAANQAESDAVLQDLGADGSAEARLRRAIGGWYRYTIEAPGVPAFLAEAWAVASRKPLIRDMVARRHERIVTVATVVLREGVAAGELAPAVHVETTARALAALLDGVVLECISSGMPPTRTDVESRALLLIGTGVIRSATDGGPRLKGRPRLDLLVT
jgi:AcrR family transcriptional regulator